jgi:hypothetical protein
MNQSYVGGGGGGGEGGGFRRTFIHVMYNVYTYYCIYKLQECDPTLYSAMKAGTHRNYLS